MTGLVFVDTTAWYAAADPDDTSHQRATGRLSEFAGRLVTSDHILVETWYLAASRLGRHVAEQLVDGIRGGIARVESAQLADFEVASATYLRFRDQDFSIVDRTSWSVMRRLGVSEAVAFDVDYSIYRYGQDLRQSFTVHN